MDSVVTGLFDLSKAFDMVNHKLLLGEMEAIGIRGVSNDWFASYFKKTHHIVVNFDANGDGYIERQASSRALIKIEGGGCPRCRFWVQRCTFYYKKSPHQSKFCKISVNYNNTLHSSCKAIVIID